MNDTSNNSRWTLRDLPFAARFTIATFLFSVSLGYFSALVNLHFQTATPGEPLPTPNDVQRDFSGKSKVSQLERLLVANPSLPFNGQGSMRSAFTRKAGGLTRMRKETAKRLKLDLNNPKEAREVDRKVEQMLNGERLALLAWVRDGAPKKAYEEDEFALQGKLADLVIDPKMLVIGQGGERSAKITSILGKRCVRCHDPNVGGPGAEYPLTSYEDVTLYTEAEKATGKSLTKLALTTHVHLLGFSMLYGLTGLLFALTRYPGLLRFLIAPLPLLAQVADISCWWLARLDEPHGPMFAHFIPITGAIVATGLGLQVLLTLFDLFGKTGKAVVFVLLVAAAGGGLGMKDKVTHYLANEKAAAAIESTATE
jgi:hypothetical protein